MAYFVTGESDIGVLRPLPLGLPADAYEDDDIFPRAVHFADNAKVVVNFFTRFPMMYVLIDAPSRDFIYKIFKGILRARCPTVKNRAAFWIVCSFL